MEQRIIEDWILKLGGTNKDGTSTIELECTFLVRIGDDIVSMTKVKSVTFTEDYVELRSDKERLFAPPSSIEALKVTDEAATNEARAGFH